MDNNLIVVSPRSGAPDGVLIKGTVQLRDKVEILTVAAGVAVKEQGTSNGATTNEKGGFKLSVKDGAAVLEVSYVGYKQINVPLNGRSDVNITLEIDVRQ